VLEGSGLKFLHTVGKDTVGVVGLGRVGLTTATCFASRGFETVGLDNSRDVLDKLRKGHPHFYEPKLEPMLKEAIEKGRIHFTSSYAELVGRSTTLFITVGTPSSKQGGMDLTHVRSAARSLGRAMRELDGFRLIVVKSTVLPGTTVNVVKPLLEKSSGWEFGEFGLCNNPEFLQEGNAVGDTFWPGRIVIGEVDRRSGLTLKALYRRFHDVETPHLLRTTPTNSELIKYACNAFLAMKVSFINQIADICEQLPDTDVATIAKGMGLDRRIGRLFLKAGLGYGGSCFTKDQKALQNFAKSTGVSLPLLQGTMQVNRRRVDHAVRLAENLIGLLKGKRIAVLGLSFKPDSDDIRDAASIRLIQALLSKGANVIAYDPIAMENAKRVFGGRIEYAPSPIRCLTGADCCFLATEWEEFSGLSPKVFVENMQTPAVIDGRKIYDPDLFHKAGVRFESIGHGHW
jgi:UDPglucose 6-dehydrogenase